MNIPETKAPERCFECDAELPEGHDPEGEPFCEICCKIFYCPTCGALRDPQVEDVTDGHCTHCRKTRSLHDNPKD